MKVFSIIQNSIIAITLSTQLTFADEELDFNRDVRPILSDKCFFCHGPDAEHREADLRLDIAEGAFADRDGHVAIIPHKPDESDFMKRILDVDEPMPPKESNKVLTQKEINILKQWIAKGAKYEDPWAYVAPKESKPPKTKNTDWAKNWIDHYVLSHLEKNNLQPSPDAEPVTLIRRLSFDLTGLPPTPKLVADYTSGKINYEQAVDSLLASPHYGERMAMYWLDLVRYADTVGYHGDQDHHITPYRDYVIRAFNTNLRFDQFTKEQLAGDLLKDPTDWQKVASGYNRLLQTSHEGGIQAKEYNAIYAADRVRNVSEVWMGATIGCAQCHDHKYDPFTINDHYSMAAFFSDIHDKGFSGNTLPTHRPPEMFFRTEQDHANIKTLQQQIKALVGDETWAKIKPLQAQYERLAISHKDRGASAKIKGITEKIQKIIPKDQHKKWQSLTKKINDIGRLTMITEAKSPRTMRILPRGNWQDDSGDIVKPAVPEFLGKINTQKERPANRLDLANWLTNPDPAKGTGGMTARVFANRFWYLFFGRGISPSLSDFGGQGQSPENALLLDQLAVSFYQNNWDVKKLVRLIVTSRAYRQSSVASEQLLEKDPYNQLVARQSRYRLPAEMVRDNALSVSGLLVNEIGGKSVKPYQPAGYYRHLNFPKRTYKQDNNNQQWRRGIYVHWQRMFPHPMMKALDAPSREECTPERTRSNTPTAALVLLNDPTFVEAARVLAQKVINEGGNNFAKRLNYAYKLTLSREPDKEELEMLRTLWQTTHKSYQDQPSLAPNILANGFYKNNNTATPPADLASWTAVTRALLNLYETTTRN